MTIVAVRAKYLLDANICIFIRRARPASVLERFRALESGEVIMSAISYGELLYGVEKSLDAASARVALASLATLIPVHALPTAAAEHYGAVRAALERDGNMIGNNDLWIAAHALAEGLVVVTHDRGAFSRVPGLQVEDWVAGA